MVPKKYRYRYRKYLVPEESPGNIWKIVSEPVSEKFDTGTDFSHQNLGILKIYNGYWYRIGTGTENFFIFLVVSEPVSEKIGTGKKSRNRYRSNLVSEKSLGTGLGKIWYRKKYRYRYRKYLVPEKSIGIVQHFGYRHTLIQHTMMHLQIILP